MFISHLWELIWIDLNWAHHVMCVVEHQQVFLFCAWTNQRTITHMALTNLKYQGFFSFLFSMNSYESFVITVRSLIQSRNSLHHKRISHIAFNFTNPSTFCLCFCKTGSTSSSTLAPWRCCPIHQLRCCLISWYTQARWNATLEDNLGDTQWPP